MGDISVPSGVELAVTLAAVKVIGLGFRVGRAAAGGLATLGAVGVSVVGELEWRARELIA